MHRFGSARRPLADSHGAPGTKSARLHSFLSYLQAHNRRAVRRAVALLPRGSGGPVMTGSRRYLWLVTVACMAACSEHGPTEPALEQYHGVPSFAISAGSFTLASNSAHSTTGTLSIGAPAVILGDVLIAHIVVRNMNGPTTSTPHVICAPAGWVSIRRTNNKVD